MNVIQLKSLLSASEELSTHGPKGFIRAVEMVGHEAAFAILVHEVRKNMQAKSIAPVIDELSMYVEPRLLYLYVKEHLFFYISEEMALDNFSAHSIEWNGVLWQTCEHAYQAAKFDYEGGHSDIVTQIKTARSPFEAKRIAQVHKDKVKKNWGKEKVGVMSQIIRLKIKQHHDVRSVLLATGSKILVENSRTDNFWGSGNDYTGFNYTGRLWMEARDDIRFRGI